MTHQPDPVEEAENASRMTLPGGAHVSAEAVRQGHTGDHVRYILAFSLLGGIVALIAIYWFAKG